MRLLGNIRIFSVGRRSGRGWWGNDLMAYTSTSIRKTVFAKTGGRCFYCSVHIKCDEKDSLPRDWLLLRGGSNLMTIEHSNPKIRGGGDDIGNLVPSCRSCNTAKGALTVDEFRFVKAIRTRNMDFSFAFEATKPARDWLCLWSDDQEGPLFRRNFPKGAAAYSRRGESTHKSSGHRFPPK